MLKDRKIVSILLLTLVNSYGFSILIPVLPFIIERYGEDPFMYGLLLSVYPLSMFFAASVLGSLSDVWGRRKVLIVSQTGTLLSWIVFGSAWFVPDIPVLGISLPVLVILLSRILDGLTGGNNSVLNAYVADVFEPSQRSKAYGMVGATLGIGLMTGPAIGGIANATQWGYLGTMVVAGCISVATLLYLFLFLPESLAPEHRKTHFSLNPGHQLNIIGKVRAFAHNKRLLNLLFLRVFFVLMFSSYTSIIVLYIRNVFGLNEVELGLLFLLIGGFLVFNQAVMVRLFVQRIGDRKTLLTGMGLFVIGLALLPWFSYSLVVFTLNVYLNNLGFSLSLATFRSLIANSVDQTQQGEISGIDESLFSLGTAIAPVSSGLLYGGMGGSVFWLYAVGLSVGVVVYIVRELRLRQG